MKRHLLAAALCAATAVGANANLIRNPGFEEIPSNSTEQGVMPRDWSVVMQTPDTYSNDAAFGLDAAIFGNFLGVAAFEGVRWVAGWSLADERFGQLLSAPLAAAQRYELSAYLLQAKRSDLDHPGGYELYLTPAASSPIESGVLLGRLGPTADANEWQRFTLAFVAPANASALPFLLFKPFDDGTGAAYAGLDLVDLRLAQSAVPAPTSLLWLGIAALMTARRVRRHRVT